MFSLFKYALLTLCTNVIAMCGFALISSQTHAQDLLETSFKASKQFDYVINIGTDRGSVGRAFLREGYSVTIGKDENGKWSIGGKTTDPIIVRVIKWFLEIIVILGVPMLIYGGIRYIIAAGDEGAQKTARTLMINVVIGIVLALSSLAIVTLTSSLLNDQRLGQTYDQTAAQAPQGVPDKNTANDYEPPATQPPAPAVPRGTGPNIQ